MDRLLNRKLTRRRFVTVGAAAAAGWSPAPFTPTARAASGIAGSGQALGGAREIRLTAAEGEVVLGDGTRYRKWLYDGAFPGPVLRAREGERLSITLQNRTTSPRSRIAAAARRRRIHGSHGSRWLSFRPPER